MKNAVMASYRENYERIAADHLAHWRETGVNPWQSPEHVARVNAVTAGLIMRYSTSGDPVLDAGCAMGELLLGLADRECHGCDFVADYVEIARSRGISAVKADLEHLPYPDGRFAVVAAADVLEHVLDEKIVLREMLRVIRPGGHLIIRSPDSEDLTPYTQPEAPYRYVHLRRFDMPGLYLLLDRIMGVNVVEFVITPNLPGESSAPGEINVVARKP